MFVPVHYFGASRTASILSAIGAALLAFAACAGPAVA
jgi:hypothetical protein